MTAALLVFRLRLASKYTLIAAEPGKKRWTGGIGSCGNKREGVVGKSVLCLEFTWAHDPTVPRPLLFKRSSASSRQTPNTYIFIYLSILPNNADMEPVGTRQRIQVA
mmetsp:Transcript_19911/g.40480  ORF Transcript_19911/g.40480 Transcript_19911/m.40480 type:complete len:107 (+) Transcript_19911:435-755(+)